MCDDECVVPKLCGILKWDGIAERDEAPIRSSFPGVYEFRAGITKMEKKNEGEKATATTSMAEKSLGGEGGEEQAHAAQPPSTTGDQQARAAAARLFVEKKIRENVEKEIGETVLRGRPGLDKYRRGWGRKKRHAGEEEDGGRGEAKKGVWSNDLRKEFRRHIT